MWDSETGDCLGVLQGHAQWIYTLTFTYLQIENSSESKLVLASSGDDRTIRFWDIETGKCLKTLRSERPYGRHGHHECKRLVGASSFYT
ncbi:hypothetical protein IQ241_11260 [Romeria aff. gracilis LEGE 07310]|uniref:Uncharacterized protein n=1 Tax=Vasconcelosia minhoensis LEGE 07310 TaxID=915328 RepID=A0A8J7AMU8_9CYAN|nr:hypothetical protein [Romeria aff. gracilis LEGE 07310]